MNAYRFGMMMFWLMLGIIWAVNSAAISIIREDASMNSSDWVVVVCMVAAIYHVAKRQDV